MKGNRQHLQSPALSLTTFLFPSAYVTLPRGLQITSGELSPLKCKTPAAEGAASSSMKGRATLQGCFPPVPKGLFLFCSFYWG